MLFFQHDNIRFGRDTFRKSTSDFEKVPVAKKPKILPVKVGELPLTKKLKKRPWNRIWPWQLKQFCPWHNKTDLVKFELVPLTTKKVPTTHQWFFSENFSYQLRLLFFLLLKNVNWSYILSKPRNGRCAQNVLGGYKKLGYYQKTAFDNLEDMLSFLP